MAWQSRQLHSTILYSSFSVWLLPRQFQLCLICAAFVLLLSHFVASHLCEMTAWDCYRCTVNMLTLYTPWLAQPKANERCCRKDSRIGPSLPHADYVFLKQALKAMAQPGEPIKYLGRIGVPLLHLSWMPWVRTKIASVADNGSLNPKCMGASTVGPCAWTLSRKEATKICEGNDPFYGHLYRHVCV